MIGTEANPLRVAIIGSGPSGFYAAEALQKQTDYVVEIDMYDRLPTPHGLVRGGVAPDHQKIKSVTKVYDRIAAKPNFRFYGNVEFGTDVTHDDLVKYYHQIVYAVGSQTDRRLGIPGEDLSGSHPATEFVAWYNAHPDYRELTFDLTQEVAVVVGNGNVAMDVVRILASSRAELERTDIADYALEALANSSIKTIIMLGRRGPAQAAYTNPEIKELGDLEEAQVIVSEADGTLDALSQAFVDESEDRTVAKNVEVLQGYMKQPADPSKKKQIIMRFLVSPTEIHGTDQVEQVTIVHNELYKNDRGTLRPRATDRTETLDAELVFRSIGYQGVSLPGVPFRDDWKLIPNNEGRVTDGVDGDELAGEYVVGWIKRGPSGVIGTNKPDSVETVNHMVEDVTQGRYHTPTETSRDAVENLLRARGVQYVSYEDWQVIDQIETQRGEALGRPRLKFSDPAEMLRVIAESKTPDPAGD